MYLLSQMIMLWGLHVAATTGGALNKLFDLLDERALKLPEIAEMLEPLNSGNGVFLEQGPPGSKQTMITSSSFIPPK